MQRIKSVEPAKTTAGKSPPPAAASHTAKALSLGVLALMGVVGCYNPDLTAEGFFRCTDGQCPDGLVCGAAGTCGVPGGSESGCVAGPITELSENLRSSIGLALDPILGRMHVSFAGPSSVLVASRDVPDGRWSLQPYSPRTGAAGQLGFTAVDAHDGRLAVVFDGERQDRPPGPVDFVPRSVHIATTPQGGSRSLEVEYGEGSGAYLAVRLLPGRPTMLVAYRSDNRTQVALVEHETRLLDWGPVEVGIPVDGPQQAGQFNRIVLTEQNSENVQAHVASLAVGGAGEVESTQSYLAQVSFPPSFEPAEPLGELSIDIPAAARGLDLEQDGGLHAVWTEKPGNQTQVMYQAPGQPPQLVQPNGERPASAGAPTLAVREGRVGLAYIDSAGVLWLTVRPSPAGGSWLPALALQDTREAGARQAKLAIIGADESSVVLALTYANNARQLRYRTISCALP